MRRFMMFGAVMITQGMAIVPAGALAQAYVGDNAAGYAPPTTNPSYYDPSGGDQGGTYPSGQYGYPQPPAQPYPAQPYPPQPYSVPSSPAQPYPAQPVPPQVASPDSVCPNGRFFDHMTKTCESP
ncbi:hypothetical protein ACMAUO_06725 [Gluconacetobacter sp. Hr-1-5]|uniref:hypothetical protein n=1 Tax=Gluconacetobacter sp. Hr-1-5 TaxID=3395370 RepID=UPI003B519784